MKVLQWVPLIATLVLIHILRWWHIGVTDFKIFVLILIVWSFLMILYYHANRGARVKESPDSQAGPEAGLTTED